MAFPFYNGEWWYWMPGNYWMYFRGAQWNRYDPSAFQPLVQNQTFDNGYGYDYGNYPGYYDGRYGTGYRGYGYNPYFSGNPNVRTGAAIGGAIGGNQGAYIGGSIGRSAGRGRR